jgi:hypothetical protein
MESGEIAAPMNDELFDEIILVKLSQIPQAEFSDHFIEQLREGWRRETRYCDAIVDAIKRLQTGRPTKAKGPKQFQGDVLAGFWKMHFYDPDQKTIIKNILISNGLDEESTNEALFDDNFRRIRNEVFGKNSTPPKRLEKWCPKIRQVVNETTNWIFDQLQKRKNDEAYTSEWIIFRPLDAGNRRLFLLLANHHDEGTIGDQKILREIHEKCGRQFPHLF